MSSCAGLENPPNGVAGDNGLKGKTILITGGLGFVGKLLTEKVLRTCPLVRKIYLLIRDKKENKAETRLNEIFKDALFDILKNMHGEQILTKVVAIAGDIEIINLGLSKEDRKMLTEELEIIYHSAATIRFDEPLKKAILCNTRGTKLLLNLARECKNLLAFVHVSTAFCCPQETIVYEKPYPAPTDPDLIISICETMSDDIIEIMSAKLMRSYPNTYIYSKSLAEDILVKEMNSIPIIIIRPSIVSPVWKDPIPGWTNNIDGPISVFAAVGKGVLQTINTEGNRVIDFVPVDTVVNALIWSTYLCLNNNGGRIYNVCGQLFYTFKEVFDINQELFADELPLNGALWYPTVAMNSYLVLHYIRLILFQYIPATCLDALSIVLGKKPRMWKIQMKLGKFLALVDFFIGRNWQFDDKLLREDSKLMNKTEIELYTTSLDGIDFKRYVYNTIHGMRLFVLNEKDETIPQARIHTKRMWFVDKIYKAAMFLFFAFLLYQYVIIPLYHGK